MSTSVSETIQKVPTAKARTILGKQKICSMECRKSKVCTNSVADWYKLLIKTLSSALKTMFTQHSHDAITVTWKMRHFRHLTSEQNKVSKKRGS